MADRWLFAGGGLETLRLLSGAPIVGGTYNATYADHAVQCDSTNYGIADFIDTAVVGETLNVRLTCYFDFSTTVSGYVELRNAAGFPWLAFRNLGATDFGLYYNSGTGASPVWTRLGTESHNDLALIVLNFWVTLGSPHQVGWAVNGTLKGEYSFTQASFTDAAGVVLKGATNTDQSYSELAATVGINLIDSHVFYGKPTGAGSNSGFTGAYTAIDDVGVNDADAISSGTAAQRSTFAYSNVPTLGANEALGDVFLWTRGRNSGGAPSNIKPVRRDSGGTDNVGSNLAGVAGTYANIPTVYSGLTETEFNASEFGVESAT